MTNKQAVAEFARGLLAYLQDGSVVEVRECGFFRELKSAIRAGGLDEECDEDFKDEDYWIDVEKEDFEDEDYWTDHKGG